MLWTSKPDSIAGRDKRIFYFSEHPDWPWGPPSLILEGYSSGGNKAVGSLSSDAKAKNEWSCTSKNGVLISSTTLAFFHISLLLCSLYCSVSTVSSLRTQFPWEAVSFFPSPFRHQFFCPPVVTSSGYQEFFHSGTKQTEWRTGWLFTSC